MYKIRSEMRWTVYHLTVAAPNYRIWQIVTFSLYHKVLSVFHFDVRDSIQILEARIRDRKYEWVNEHKNLLP